MQLKDRVALVTGAGSGIGKAAALLLAREGVRIGVLSRSGDEVRDTVKEIEAEGSEALALAADIARAPMVQRAVQKITDAWGRLDIVFANAGINGVWAPIDHLKPNDWKHTIDINLNGTYHTIRYAVPALKKKGGSVIITSSINGTRTFSNSGATAYSCTKAAQVAMAKMLALELARHRVRVNVICPGAIATDISENTRKRELHKAREPVQYPEGEVPLTRGKPGTAEDVANLVLFLASDASRHITGTEIWIDGAQSLLKG